MGGLHTAWLIARRRILANGRMLAALTLGILIASSLLASTPIYARALADLGLGFAVKDRLTVAPVTRVLTLTDGFPLGSPAARTVQGEIAERIRQRLGWFTARTVRYIRTPPLTVGKTGQPIPEGLDRPQVFLQSLDGYESHVRVREGKLPIAPTSGGAAPEFQVALASAGAADVGLKVGDHFQLGDVFDDCERHPPMDGVPPDPPCTPHTTALLSAPAVVTAIVEPLDVKDQFWLDGPSSYFIAPRPAVGSSPRVMAFLSADAMLGAFASLFPNYWVQQHWYTLADVSRLNRDNYKRALAEMKALNGDIEAAGFIGFSTLPQALQSFDQALSYNQTPLLILILQITGIALFYVVIVAATSVERQQTEIALLRGRGASLRQIVLVYLIEGVILGVPCILIAPYLGVLFTRLLGLTPVFHPVTHGHLITAAVDPLAFALAALGVTLSIASLLIPAMFAAGFSGITLRRRHGRPSPSIVRRYYLDLGLVAICGILLWELRSRGSVYTPGTSGGLSSDPLLLLAPTLLTLAIAALILRVYPVLLRLAGKAFAAGSGVTVVLGIWQMTRHPAQYTRLGLLLMMGLAVGGFAATYSDTTNRSFSERALYQAGVDVRASLPEGGVTGPPSELDAQLRQATGVTTASTAIRIQAAPGPNTEERYQLLGVDPAAARGMLWYRKGLSHDPLATYMRDLGTPTQQIGIPVPGEPAVFSAWVNPKVELPNVTAWVRFREQTGHFGLYELGKLDFTGWRQMTTQLMDLDRRPVFPVALVSIVLTEPSNFLLPKQQPVYFDDFHTVAADGSETVVEDFEGLAQWTAAPTTTLNQDTIAVTGDTRHGGQKALQFTFQPGQTTGVRGFFVTDPNVPLPAVISRDLSRRLGAPLGGVTAVFAGGLLVPLRVTGVADLFPTLDPANGPFLIVNRQHLVEWLNRMTDSRTGVNEAWITTAPGTDRDALFSQLSRYPYQLAGFIDLGTELKLDGADPLQAAGGSGILQVAFIALLVLIAGAFLVSIYASFQRRRVEFAVMSALGLGRGRVFSLLAFEFSVITAIGAVAGVVLGLAISRLMLSFLDVTAGGRKVVPPFVLQTNWAVLGVGVACLAAIVAGCIAIGVRMFTSESESSVLRIAE